MQTEDEIIKAIAKGSEQAFTTFYELYAKKVFNTALSYTKNTEEAQDITQDVFVKIYRKATTFKGKSSVNTWVYRIVINTSLNYLDKKSRKADSGTEIKNDDVINFNHPGVILENKENAATLYRVIDCLIENQKTAFILSYIEELPRQEVADIMETSVKAVESLLQRAKANMRKELENLYPNRRK